MKSAFIPVLPSVLLSPAARVTFAPVSHNESRAAWLAALQAGGQVSTPAATATRESGPRPYVVSPRNGRPRSYGRIPIASLTLPERLESPQISV